MVVTPAYLPILRALLTTVSCVCYLRPARDAPPVALLFAEFEAAFDAVDLAFNFEPTDLWDYNTRT